MTVDEFRDAMAPLGANPWKYGKGLTRPIMNLYWSAFKELDAAVFAKAVTRHLATASEFPSIADLRHALGAGGGSLLEAALIFDKLCKAAPRYDARKGDYWIVGDVLQMFGAQAVAAFLVAGGSIRFRDRTDQDLPFLRRDFLKGWESYDSQDRALQVALNASEAPRGLAPIQADLTRLLPPKEDET